jgi:hypothetical protein
MHKFAKLVMAALVAAFVLSLAAGPAGARNRVEVSTTSVRATSSRLTFGGSEIDIICNVTLAGTLRRLINKRRGEPVGSFTADTVNTCSSNFGSEARADALTPMSITYGTIEGSLPSNITGGTLDTTGGFLISVRTIFGTSACLYSGTITSRSENPARTLRIQPNTSRLSRRLSGICPETGELAGSFTSTPAVTIRLLEP